jgi:hypothetical protein
VYESRRGLDLCECVFKSRLDGYVNEFLKVRAKSLYMNHLVYVNQEWICESGLDLCM